MDGLSFCFPSWLGLGIRDELGPFPTFLICKNDCMYEEDTSPECRELTQGSPARAASSFSAATSDFPQFIYFLGVRA